MKKADIGVLKSRIALGEKIQRRATDNLLELGKKYAEDSSDPENKNRAVDCWRLAAEHGEIKGFMNIGRLHAHLYMANLEIGGASSGRLRGLRNAAIKSFQSVVKAFKDAPEDEPVNFVPLVAEASLSAGFLYDVHARLYMEAIRSDQWIDTIVAEPLVSSSGDLSPRLALVKDDKKRMQMISKIGCLEDRKNPLLSEHRVLYREFGKDMELAVQSYDMAVLVGTAETKARALNALGCLYDGFGIKESDPNRRDKAYETFKIAAEDGWGESQINLGLMIDGRDAPQDLLARRVIVMSEAQRARNARLWMQEALKRGTPLSDKTRQETEAFCAGEVSRPPDQKACARIFSPGFF